MERKDRKKRIIMPSRNNAVLQSPETSDDGALDGGGFDDVVVTGQDLEEVGRCDRSGSSRLVFSHSGRITI